MKFLIVTTVKIYCYKNKYYASESFSYILKRYKKKFNNITLLTRIIYNDKMPNDYIDISDCCTAFQNSESTAKSLLLIKNERIKNLIKESDFIILRVPSIISFTLYKYIKKYKKKYLVEVMGCAWDAYWNHDILGKIIALYGFVSMKMIVYNANYATYVTEEFLQKRYPCKNYSVGVSNVKIDEINMHNDYGNFNPKDFSMMTAAAVNVKYKGQQYVIKAISKLKRKNIIVKYYLAGGGDNSYLKRLALKYRVDNQVVFLGKLSHSELLEYMKKIDFYIQPSLQEGLPRAVIEAMSCGCICFGANTAGIPELINKKYIFKRRSSKAIVNKLLESLDDNLSYVSKENAKNSKKYFANILDEKRFIYYDRILEELNNL